MILKTPLPEYLELAPIDFYLTGIVCWAVNVKGLMSVTVLLYSAKSSIGQVPDLSSKSRPRSTALLTVTVPALQGCIVQ